MGRRWLIVDDSPAFRSSAATLLGSQGIDVVGVASSADEALRAARTLAPDVVLVDVELADEDGVELSRRLLEQDPGVAVVLLSAYDPADVAELVTDAGATGFVPKTALGARAIERLLGS
jgi:two-component system, NarL family, nitrate/nitrite response regulator NarL